MNQLRHRSAPSTGIDRWRPVVIVVIAAASLVFVLSRRADLIATVGVVSHLALQPLLLAVGLSALAILNRAGLFRSAHRAVGLEADLTSMTRVSAAGYALNKVVKTGGLGGMALFVRHGERRGQPAGKVVAAYVVASTTAHLALVACVGLAAVSLAAAGSLTATTLVTASIVFTMAAAGLITLWLGLRSRTRVRRWYAHPFHLHARLATKLGRPSPTPPDLANADRFYDAASAIRERPSAALPVAAHAIAAKLLGAGVLAASLAATGAGIGIGAALIVYVLALIASTASLLPGGLGAVEASMAVLLGTYGVPTGAALAAILTFRLLDLWLPLLVGLVAARSQRATHLRAPLPEPVLVAA